MKVTTTTLEALRVYDDGQTCLPQCFRGEDGAVDESKRDNWIEWTLDALGAAVMGYPIPAPEDYLFAAEVRDVLEFIGQECAVQLAALLVRDSTWFELTPLPDDGWRFAVRPGEHYRLETLFIQAEERTG